MQMSDHAILPGVDNALDLLLPRVPRGDHFGYRLEVAVYTEVLVSIGAPIGSEDMVRVKKGVQGLNVGWHRYGCGDRPPHDLHVFLRHRLPRG